MSLQFGQAQQLVERAQRRKALLDELRVPEEDPRRWTFATQDEVAELKAEVLKFGADTEIANVKDSTLRVYGLRVEIINDEIGGGRR